VGTAWVVRHRDAGYLSALYGPLQSWFDKAWKPGEIEEVK